MLWRAAAADVQVALVNRTTKQQVAKVAVLQANKHLALLLQVLAVAAERKLLAEMAALLGVAVNPEQQAQSELAETVAFIPPHLAAAAAAATTAAAVAAAITVAQAQMAAAAAAAVLASTLQVALVHKASKLAMAKWLLHTQLVLQL